MGFTKGHNVAELVHCFRLLRNRTLEWGGGRSDSTARFCRRIGHRGPLLAARGAVRAEALWYIRETQATSLKPSHGPWAAGEVRPERGLKQGCSCPPKQFRWCVQDVLRPLAASWRARGLGVPTEWVTHLVWADDTWIMAQTPEHLAVMIDELQRAMCSSVGFVLSEVPSCDVPSRRPDVVAGSGRLRPSGSLYGTEWKAYHARKAFWGR